MGWGLFGGSDPAPGRVAEPTNRLASYDAKTDASIGLIPIEQIEVGMRVPSENPVENYDHSLGEVDSSTWKKITCVAPKKDGSADSDVVLLRPDWWLDAHKAETGSTVFISVPECGIDGNARVISIEPCPTIPDGPGQVVTGTFAHQSAQILDLKFEGDAEPIGTTINHPFFSADRNAFVRADELEVDEQVQVLDGKPIKLTSISRRGPPEPVFNIEVHGQHAYFVGKTQLLVHNGTEKICEGTNPSLIALGLDETEKTLTKFTQQLNNSGARVAMYGDTAFYNIANKNGFVGYNQWRNIENAIENADGILFNLKNMDVDRFAEFAKHYTLGKHPGTANFTNGELFLILKNGHQDKTLFFNGNISEFVKVLD